MADKPKEGSRKRAVFDLFTKKSGTYEQALALGLKLEVQVGTVRSWCMTWDRTKVPASPKKAPPPAKKKATGDKPSPSPKRAVAPPPEFLPHFKHKTRDGAGEHLAAICKRASLRASAFHVLEQDGRFAVVPAHHKPPAPPPLFKKGDLVFDAYVPNGMATVTTPGAEQTEIKYKTERKSGLREACVNNYYLYKLEPEKTEEKTTKTKTASKPKAKTTTRQRL